MPTVGKPIKKITLALNNITSVISAPYAVPSSSSCCTSLRMSAV